MSAERAERMLQAPLAELERALIEAFIHGRGFDPHQLASIPEAQRDALLRDACRHASTKLAEIESRWHFLHDLHE